MRILITVGTYKPHTDGVQFVTSYLAEGLAKKGCRVDVATCMGKSTIREEEINGVRVTRWPYKTVHMFHRGGRKAFQTWVLENQNRYDLMINVGTQVVFTDWILSIISRISIPKILHIHSVWDFKIKKYDASNPKKLFVKLFGNIRWGFYFIAHARHFKQYDALIQLHEKDYSVPFMKKLCGRDSFVLENAVDDVFFQQQPTEKRNQITYIANFSEMKDQKRAVRVFYEAKLPPEWELCLVGSSANEYYRDLLAYNQAFAQTREESRVRILTEVPREKIAEMVRQSKIFLMTSKREAYPVSIAEAMAAGVPFVSTDVGVVREFPGGIVGKSDKRLIEALRHFAGNEESRSEYGQKGKRYAAEHCVMEKQTEKLYDLIRQIKEKGQTSL